MVIGRGRKGDRVSVDVQNGRAVGGAGNNEREIGVQCFHVNNIVVKIDIDGRVFLDLDGRRRFALRNVVEGCDDNVDRQRDRLGSGDHAVFLVAGVGHVKGNLRGAVEVGVGREMDRVSVGVKRGRTVGGREVVEQQIGVGRLGVVDVVPKIDVEGRVFVRLGWRGARIERGRVVDRRDYDEEELGRIVGRGGIVGGHDSEGCLADGIGSGRKVQGVPIGIKGGREIAQHPGDREHQVVVGRFFVAEVIVQIDFKIRVFLDLDDVSGSVEKRRIVESRDRNIDVAFRRAAVAIGDRVGDGIADGGGNVRIEIVEPGHSGGVVGKRAVRVDRDRRAAGACGGNNRKAVVFVGIGVVVEDDNVFSNIAFVDHHRFIIDSRGSVVNAGDGDGDRGG